MHRTLVARNDSLEEWLVGECRDSLQLQCSHTRHHLLKNNEKRSESTICLPAAMMVSAPEGGTGILKKLLPSWSCVPNLQPNPSIWDFDQVWRISNQGTEQFSCQWTKNSTLKANSSTSNARWNNNKWIAKVNINTQLFATARFVNTRVQQNQRETSKNYLHLVEQP
jgi:hypothetical protein